MFGKNRLTAKQITGIVLLAFIGGFLGGLAGGHYRATIAGLPAQPPVSEESRIIRAIENTAPAVVSVVATQHLPLYRDSVMDFDDLFFEGLMPESATENGHQVGGGSGILVSRDGQVLTNYHVVDDPDLSYSVITSEGVVYEVTDIKADPLHDIALLTISGADGKRPCDLPTVTLGDPDGLKVGQRVIAIGNSLAAYSNTVTTGIVSALGRNIPADSLDGGSGLIDLIQTDATIHPGNSGGPLIDLDGEVVGITTAVAANLDGIGFAVPMADILPIFD